MDHAYSTQIPPLFLVKHRKVLQVIILSSIGYLFFVFHGLAFHLTPWSQVMVNGVVKHVYDQSKQGDTTVLLFDEKDLKALKTYYPVPWELHADVLNALTTYAPKTVVIDFAFMDRRPGENLSALTDSLCALKRQGTHVLIVSPDISSPNYGVLSELTQCTTPVSARIDTEEGASGVLTYPHIEQGREGKILPTAAFATFEVNQGPLAERKDLEVMWPSSFSPINGKWMECSRPGLMESAREMFAESPLSVKRRCPYTQTIMVKDLLGSSGDMDIDHALRGKTVFYGGGFHLSGDLVSSPVFEELPGVYMHAMAYDNLITYGTHYKRADRDSKATKFMDLFLLLTVAILLIYCPRVGDSRPLHMDQKVSHYLKAAQWLFLFIITPAVLLFLVRRALEIEDLVLGAALLYLMLRLFVLKDYAFGVFVAIAAVTAFVAFQYFDLGPRNLLSFLVFAEVVRHLQKHLAEISERHQNMLGHWAHQGWWKKTLMWVPWIILVIFSATKEEEHTCLADLRFWQRLQ